MPYCIECKKEIRPGPGRSGKEYHRVNRKGAKPVYIHNSCFEALLPKKKEKVIK